MLRFTVASDVVPVDTNPEMADVGNPQGLVFGRRYFVTAHTQSHEFVHFKMFADEADADRLLSRVVAAKGFHPKDSQYWTSRVVYGSAAWGTSQECELQRADVEAEFGAGSYHVGGPGFIGN